MFFDLNKKNNDNIIACSRFPWLSVASYSVIKIFEISGFSSALFDRSWALLNNFWAAGWQVLSKNEIYSWAF